MRGRMKGIAVIMMLTLVSPAVLIAQTDPPQIMESFDLVTPPGSAVAGVVHVEDLRIGNHWQLHTIVTTNDGSADLTFDGRTIRFGDGYTIVRETLANKGGVRVDRLTASAPDGTTASAVILANRASREATAVGIERYVQLLQQSHDARMAGLILPQLTLSPAAHAASLKGFGVITPHATSCAQAGLDVEMACAGVIIGCGSDNPLVCGGALYYLGEKIGIMMDTCDPPSYDDGTIGWA